MYVTAKPLAPAVPLRIGVLIPPANTTCETEYALALPTGTSVHFQRLQRTDRTITADSLVAMKDSVDLAAETLAFAMPDVIAYACTSGSFLSGDGLHDEIATRIAGRIGLPAVTTSTAVLHALRSLGATRVYLIAPYPLPITAQSVSFLQANGVEVVGHFTFDKPDSAGIRSVSADALQAKALEAVRSHSQAQAVFICCTNLPSLGYIAALEQTLGLPVVSSNSATIWAAARTGGLSQDLPALGALGRLS